jgi:hypothetical protein
MTKTAIRLAPTDLIAASEIACAEASPLLP